MDAFFHRPKCSQLLGARVVPECTLPTSILHRTARQSGQGRVYPTPAHFVRFVLRVFLPQVILGVISPPPRLDLLIHPRLSRRHALDGNRAFSAFRINFDLVAFRCSRRTAKTMLRNTTVRRKTPQAIDLLSACIYDLSISTPP